MKKKTFILALLCALAPALHAQEPSSQESTSLKDFLKPSLHLGLAGGYSNNRLDLGTAYADDYHYVARSGLTMGLTSRLTIIDFPNSGPSLLLPDVSVSADLLLVQKNYKFYRNFSSNWIDLSYLYTVHTNNYLNIPVMAQLRWGKNLHLMAQGGFYLGGWLTAHREGESFSLDDLAYGDRQNSHFDEAIEFNPSRDNRFDAGWAYGFGAGFTIKKIDVSLEARWYYALTDTQKNYMLFLNHRYNTTFALQGGVSIQL